MQIIPGYFKATGALLKYLTSSYFSGTRNRAQENIGAVPDGDQMVTYLSK